MDYQYQTGCIPCNFICDCCDQLHSRCCSGTGMYYKGDSYKPTRILCETCYRECLNNTTGCLVKHYQL
ncbi:MAG TPA: hypothetical protein VLG50_07760 [Candidatus Saccharimonadales bacterium]|nr:hypothetical protein [Candidatus Saccharimonadales bacterium]